MFALLKQAIPTMLTQSPRQTNILFENFSDEDMVCFGKVCFPANQEDLNNYGEPKGYGDSPPPYDRCTQYGCGH